MEHTAAGRSPGRRSPGCRTERSSPGRRGSLSGRRAELSRPAPVLTAVDRRAGACTTVGSSRSFSSIRRRAAALCSCRKKEKCAGSLLARASATAYRRAQHADGGALWDGPPPCGSRPCRRSASAGAVVLLAQRLSLTGAAPTPHAHSPSDWLTDRDGRRAAALLERGNSCYKICLDHPYGLGHLTGGLDWIGFFFNLSWTKLDVDC